MAREQQEVPLALELQRVILESGMSLNQLGKQTGVANIGGGIVNATENWWGCSAGPGANGCASVSGSGVLSVPWLTSPH